MPGQDVRQLLLQVDASVAVAQRNLSALRNQVERDTQAMEGALQKPEDALGRYANAHGAVVHASGNARVAQMELMHVVRSSADSFASGQQVMTIFAMEIGRVAEAASFAGGSLGRFGAIMGGGWGLAITAGISLLTALIAGHRGSADAAHAHETAEETLARAMAGEEDAVRKVTEAMEAQRDASQHAIESSTRRTAVAYGEAQANYELARSAREVIRANLAREIERAEANQRAANDPTLAGEGGFNPGAAAAANSQVGDLRAQLALQDRLMEGYAASMAARAVEMSRAMATPQGRLDIRSDVQQRQFEAPYLRRIASAQTDPERFAIMQEMSRGEAALTTAREAGRRAIDESESAERRRNSTIETGRNINMAQAAAMVHAAGGTVTSMGRSHAEQARLYARYLAGQGPLAAPPGSSAHEGPNPHAIDITGMSIGQVREMFRGQGVHLRQLIMEADPRTGGQHVHADFGSGTRAPSAETLARRQAAAQARQVHQDDQFGTELSQANERLIQAKRELATTTESQVGFAIEQARIDGQQRDLGYQHQVNEHRLTAAEAKRLTALNDAATEAQVAALRQREDRRLADEAARMQVELLGSERDILQTRMGLADTDRDRLAIGRRILANEKEAERLQLTNTLRFGSGASSDQIGSALIRYNRLDTSYAARGAALDRQYESPSARYMRELRAGTADVNTQLQTLEVRSMQALDDATKNTIKSVLHLHGAFGDIIADLIMIYVRRAALGALDGAGGGGFLGSILGALGLGAGAGGGKGVASAGSAVARAFGGAREGGGPVSAGMAYLVGEKRAEIFVPNASGTILPRVPQVRIPQAANSNGRMHVVVELPSAGEFDARVVGVSGPVTVELMRTAAPAMIEDAKNATMRQLARKPIA